MSSSFKPPKQNNTFTTTCFTSRKMKSLKNARIAELQNNLSFKSLKLRTEKTFLIFLRKLFLINFTIPKLIIPNDASFFACRLLI